MPPFHLAFPVRDLDEARAFYGGLLGCPEGRSSPEWIDFNFHGHQIVAHLAPDECGHKATNAVDSHNVPVRHFGLVLSMEQWEALANKLRAAGTQFVIARVALGMVPASPRPTHIRANTSVLRPPTTPVVSVPIAHSSPEMASMRRGPMRSPRYPLMI